MLRIKELRIKKGLTQKGLSESSGIKTRAIQSYEANERFPSAEKIPAISRALGVSIGELFGEEPKGASIKVLTQLTTIKKILLRQLDSCHETIKLLVGNTEELGTDLRRDIKQNMNAIRELLDLQDKTSDERMAEIKAGYVGHKVVELMNDISGLDNKIEMLHIRISSFAS